MHLRATRYNCIQPRATCRVTLCGMDNIYSIGTAAARLECHPETVRRLIRRGELSAVKLGSQWRVRESDLQKYFDAHATTAKRDDQSELTP